MNLNLTVNEAECSTPCPATPGTYQVRAFYESQQDSGHTYGPFSTKEKAEECALVLAGRTDVESVTVEAIV
jgi:hypothetical protein